MSGNTLLMRTVRVAALVAGLAVLALSIANVITGRAQQIAALDHELATEADQLAEMSDAYFDRARAIDLVVANNPVFADFYAAPGTLQQKIKAGGPLMKRINDGLAYLQELYPTQIGEACFIDSSGTEIARTVRGVPAPPAGLSPDEKRNPFFAPTFAVPAGQVYQARAYESPDTKDWVISNSTIVPGTGRRAILHFEVTLDSFRTAAKALDDGDTISIVDAKTGDIWVDSRTPQQPGQPLGRPTDHSLHGLAEHASDTGDSTDRDDRGFAQQAETKGVTTIGDRRLAYHRLASGPGNANTWLLVVSTPKQRVAWSQTLSAGSMLLLVVALLTIGVAGAGLRTYQVSLRRAASHDSLTGLPNRTLLNDRLGQALSAAKRTGGYVGAMIIDLDRFKEVNDTLGHHHGDLLLQQTAQRLQATVRGVDTVARLGGDEFAVVMPSIADPATAQLAAQRILAVLHDSFLVDGVALDVEASIGVAIGPDQGGEAAELLRHADAAMYAAKDLKSGYQVYDADREGHAPSRLALLGDLRRALESDQMVLHYQPKVDVALGRLTGVEALIRWQHPTRGMLMPGDFIEVAESTALIQRLTVHVLELALTQAQAWRAAGATVPIAVNVSTRCLLDTTFPDTVFELLDRHQLPASVLRLEITESSIMADPIRALAVLRRLHHAGIRLSIDDFGTGYSSMAYLKDLPVDELKVDRSFVKDMITETNDAMLVRSAIDLGHNLGLAIVAEGVEDETTLDALRNLGCDIAQGYHLGRPMVAEKLQDWIRAQIDDRPVPAPPRGACGYLADSRNVS